MLLSSSFALLFLSPLLSHWLSYHRHQKKKEEYRAADTNRNVSLISKLPEWFPLLLWHHTNNLSVFWWTCFLFIHVMDKLGGFWVMYMDLWWNIFCILWINGTIYGIIQSNMAEETEGENKRIESKISALIHLNASWKASAIFCLPAQLQTLLRYFSEV